MTSDNLKYVLRQFVERTLPVCRPRELVLPTETGKVIGLSGVRRSGKTFLFFDAIRRMAEQGVDRRRLVYLNFVDLCDGDGTLFLNTCWNLADPETMTREKGAMALGQTRWPDARGRLLYHEYAPGVEKTFPTAEPAWKFLVGI